MTSDVIRRLYMSYNSLFHNCLHSHNFAKSEPIDGLEYLPTDSSTPLTSRSNPPEVDSLFKRTEQVVFLYDRNYSARQKPTSSLLKLLQSRKNQTVIYISNLLI